MALPAINPGIPAGDVPGSSQKHQFARHTIQAFTDHTEKAIDWEGVIKLAPWKVKRWGGSALVAGSLLFLLNKLDDMSRVFLHRPIPDLITGRDGLLLTVGLVLLVIGCLGCYLAYAQRCNRPGKLGLLLLLGGAILLALGHASFTPFAKFEWLFVLVLLGVLLMVAGLTLFGAINLRSHALRYWQPLPLVTGLLGIAAFPLSGGDKNPFVFLSLRTLFGVGLVLMGVILWLDTRGNSAGERQAG